MVNTLKQKLYKYFLYPLAHWYWRFVRPDADGARALILRDNKVLLIKNLNLPYWTMPGGGVDKGEKAEECVIRELYEELDLTDLMVDYKLGEYYTDYEGKKGTVSIFIITPPTEYFTVQWEIADACWFPLDALPDDMSPATLRRIAEYKEGKRDLVLHW
jgi:8-oxo-dGTP pyrophosphatase MutT (NUDIX family)